MKSSDSACPICLGHDLGRVVFPYHQCKQCGLEWFDSQDQSLSFIINENLMAKKVKKKGLMDHYKQKVLNQCNPQHDMLLDVGCASGKFLFHNHLNFDKCVGIETTPECIDFAKKHFGLTILSDSASLKGPISLVTFWHSLEHIPLTDTGQLLSTIRNESSSDVKIIIAVPNVDSYQYRWFKTHFAFFDPTAHRYQFSLQSLDLLMDKFQFERQMIFAAFIFSCFGYVQGFLNLCQPIHNYYYYRRKRGWDFKKGKFSLFLMDIYNMILIGIFLMPAVGLSCIDIFHKEKGGVITACYVKKIK